MIIRDFFFGAWLIEKGFLFEVKDKKLSIEIDRTEFKNQKKLYQDGDKPKFERVKKIYKMIQESK